MHLIRRCKGLSEVRDLSGPRRAGWEAGEEERKEGSKMSPGRKVIRQVSLSLYSL